MKKAKKATSPQKRKKVYTVNRNAAVLNEPVAPYMAFKTITRPKEYSFKKFEGLSSKIPFTQKEWAAVLHLSDRTLQRYAKESKPFEGIYADRLLQIEKVVHEAAKVFKKPILFYDWLNENHRVFNYTFSAASLQTQDGIQMLLDELGRIQQGVYI
jgi:uncharacterized protein (DUF2384 family)